MTALSLPIGFEALSSYVDLWAAQGIVARDKARTCTDAQERQAFYDAAAPLLPAALAHLDARTKEKWDEADQRLMRIMLSLAHIGFGIEMLGQSEEDNTPSRLRMHLSDEATTGAALF